MKHLIIFSMVTLFFLPLKAQTGGVELPKNYTDTLFVLGNKDFDYKERSYAKVFILQDESWHCKDISFVYITIKIERKIDKRILSKKEFKKYKIVTFEELKNRDKGCNELESFLRAPTLYFLFKKKRKYIAYEVFPIVWGAGS